MEDNEEVMSHHFGGIGSPPSSSYGITEVTVTAGPLQPCPQDALILALPFERQISTGVGGNTSTTGTCGGREDCWSEGATSALIDAWGERYLELSGGNLKQKHWKEVADTVSSRDDYRKTPKTDLQCKNRIDTVKKKYKIEKQKIAVCCRPSRWPFFQRLDELIGPTAKVNALVSSRSGLAGPSFSPVPVGFSSAKDVPMGIPLVVRLKSFSHSKQAKKCRSQTKPNMNPDLNPNPKTEFKRKATVDMEVDSFDTKPGPEQFGDSGDGFPPVPKRRMIRREMMNASGYRGELGIGMNEKERSWGNSVRELAIAILKFGEAYEQAESLKLQQLVEIEKQRMKFAKELELQRMQIFTKTQMELSQLKQHSGRVWNDSNNHHFNNNNSTNNNHSDSSN